MGRFHVICKLGRKSRRISSCFSSACQGQIFASCVIETMIEEDLICPISQSIMQDPVKCSDGHTYERKYIEEHFELALEKQSTPPTSEPTTPSECRSPMTRQILHAQEANLQVKWCESSGYGGARKVWCQPNTEILEKITEFKKTQAKQLAVPCSASAATLLLSCLPWVDGQDYTSLGGG